MRLYKQLAKTNGELFVIYMMKHFKVSLVLYDKMCV